MTPDWLIALVVSSILVVSIAIDDWRSCVLWPLI